MRIALLTTVAMFAFAGNSLLCRLALKGRAIDASTFTLVRITSAALALWLINRARAGERAGDGSWYSALALFVYAAGFSLAYLRLSAGTGALLLFAAVQSTMIAYGLFCACASGRECCSRSPASRGSSCPGSRPRR